MFKNLSKKKKIILTLILIAVIIFGVILAWLVASGKLKSWAIYQRPPRGGGGGGTTGWTLDGNVSIGSSSDCNIHGLAAYLKSTSGYSSPNPIYVTQTGDYSGEFSFSGLHGSYHLTVSGGCPQASSANPLGFCNAGGEYDVSESNPNISIQTWPSDGKVTISIVHKVSCTTGYPGGSGCVGGEKTAPLYGVTVRWTNSEGGSSTFTSNYTNNGVKQLSPQPVGRFTIQVTSAPTGYNRPTIYPSVQGCQMNPFPVILSKS